MNNKPQAPSMRPYGRHVFICIHGDCAGPELGERLHQKFMGLNRQHGLNKLRNPERVKCSLVDCLGVCSGGPIMVVYPEGIWYHHVDEVALERIYSQHILGGKPVEDLMFHRLYPAGQEPAYAPGVRGDAGTWAEEQEGENPESKTIVLDSETIVTRELTLTTFIPNDENRPHPNPLPEGEETILLPSPCGGRGIGGEGLFLEENISTSSNPQADAQAVRAAVRRAKKKKGLVIVNTGNGKGKTTAALGVMTRAWGRKMRVGVLQFLKNENARFGEIKAGERMGGIDWISLGDGWTWTSKDMDETEARARRGWQVAQERIRSGNYDLLILDEFTYPLHYGWLDTAEVVGWLKANKPDMLHLIITGRYAPAALIEYADLVTEMREIKHPFREQGIRAQAGIEY
jgi:cob(I)alamin adenosyltransferase